MRCAFTFSVSQRLVIFVFVCLCLLSVNVKTVGESDNVLISVPKAKEVKGQLGFHSSTLANPFGCCFCRRPYFKLSKVKAFQSLIHFAVLSMLINSCCVSTMLLCVSLKMLPFRWQENQRGPYQFSWRGGGAGESCWKAGRRAGWEEEGGGDAASGQRQRWKVKEHSVEKHGPKHLPGESCVSARTYENHPFL